MSDSERIARLEVAVTALLRKLFNYLPYGDTRNDIEMIAYDMGINVLTSDDDE